MNAKNAPDFCEGLVFGFDVGTGSVGYAVRKGREFKDVGVIICESEGSDLSKRRELRRQRRTLRSRKYRRDWFSRELGKLGLPRPTQWPQDPIGLRIRAVRGEDVTAEELHVALVHLFRRRRQRAERNRRAALKQTKPPNGRPAALLKETLLNRCIRLADRVRGLRYLTLS